MENKWISVDERLPDRMASVNISKHVLCACRNHPIEGGYFQRTMYYDYQQHQWFLDYSRPVSWEVDFWQPLPPEPPKQ